jgi:nitrile hydratase
MSQFNKGDTVKVKIGSPDGHFRTPAYIQGKVGVVESICGSFKNPESLAYGGDGLPLQPLYTVLFMQTDVWRHYQGNPQDKILIDIYQHWLNVSD